MNCREHKGKSINCLVCQLPFFSRKERLKILREFESQNGRFKIEKTESGEPKITLFLN